MKRFDRDSRGSATVEFALIVPVLITFYFGVVELSLLLSADRKVTSVASAIGDLVAQTDETNAAEMEAIFDAADAIMQPLDVSGMELRVTSISMDFDGDVEVTWSKSRNTSAMACGATVTTPAGVLTPGQSVIYAEVAYVYTPPIGELLLGDIRLEDGFFLRPRQSVEVDYQPAMC